MAQDTGAALALRSLTIRGIGSYLHGARLDLRPLTLLCGKNGSGKSTWFKVLNLLRRSLAQGLLPFAFDSDDDGYFHDFTNAYLKTFGTEDLGGTGGAQADLEFGPLGTIGLMIEAAADLDLGGPEETPPGVDPGSLPHAFLWHGRCRRGTRFTLRLAHPRVASYGDAGTGLRDLVELTVGDQYVLRFNRSLEQRFEGGDWNPVERSHALEVSPAFLPGRRDTDRAPRRLADFEPHSRTLRPLEGAEGAEVLTALCDRAIARITALLEAALSAYFYISAIRVPESRKDLSARASGIDSEDKVRRRHVGDHGEATWDVERAFAYNLMREVETPPAEHSSQRFTPDQIHDPAGIWLLDLKEAAAAVAVTPAQRIWTLATPESREEILAAAEKLAAFTDESRRAGSYLSAEQDALKREMAAPLTRLLNDVLGNRNLYRAELWPAPPEEAAALLARGIETLEPGDAYRLNRLLIESVINRPGDHEVVTPAHPFLFEAYVSYWLRALVRTRIVMLGAKNHETSLSDTWTDPDHPPCGYLVHASPRPVPAFDPSAEDAWKADEAPDAMHRFLHVCFGEGSPSPVSPARLSAGFHQVAPLVVQAGLLRRGEFMAVENPEVHLHPSLQLALTGFLVREAAAGKTILVETHSDLVVRRVLRAILAEELSQEKIRFYFADLVPGPAGYHLSTLERLRVNDRGEIDNWPEGFMDDAVKESRRLLDIMYGRPAEAEDEE